MKREAEFRIKKRFSTGCWFEETPYDYRSKVERCDGKLSAPAAIISRAPEGWRTPRRCARFMGHRFTRQRLGVREPPTAFSRGSNNFSNFTFHPRKGPG
jgi:hypothetical protein